MYHQLDCFRQEKFILSQFWILQLFIQDVWELGAFWKPWGKNCPCLFLSLQVILGVSWFLDTPLQFLSPSLHGLLLSMPVIEFRSHPNPTCPHLMLTNYIYKGPISKAGHILRLQVEMNFRGNTIQLHAVCPLFPQHSHLSHTQDIHPIPTSLKILLHSHINSTPLIIDSRSYKFHHLNYLNQVWLRLWVWSMLGKNSSLPVDM